MNTRSTIGRSGLALVMLLLTIGLAGQRLAAEEYGAAARVNGVEISLFRLERHFEDYLRLQQRNVAAIRTPSVYKRLKREALQQLIDKELLWQEAQRNGIQVSAAAVEQAREAVADSFGNRAAFERRLVSAGFDEAGYAEYLRSEIAASRMLDRLVATTDVPDAEVRRVYAANRDRFAGASEARGLEVVREALLAQRTAEARRKVLEQLRAKARIEVLLPL